MREFVNLKLRVLCDATTISARQNLVRGLLLNFSTQVRVIGSSSLSDLEKTRTLEALVGQRMKKHLDAMKSLCKDFNVFLWVLRNALPWAQNVSTDLALQLDQQIVEILATFTINLSKPEKIRKQLSILFAQKSLTKLPLWLVHLGHL